MLCTLALAGAVLFLIFSPRGLGWTPPEPNKIINRFLFNFFGPAAYVGVFFILVACGLGVPLPEDVPLIMGGYLCALGPPRGPGSVWIMMVVGLAGILVGDSIIFKAGHDYGDKLLDTRMGKHIPRARVEDTRRLFAKHGPKLIMVARFIPGLRAVTYFVTGTSGVRYLTFVAYDGLAALVSAPVWVYLGYWAGKHNAIKRALAMAKQFQLLLLCICVACAVGFGLWWFLRKRARARAASLPPGARGEVRVGPKRNGHAGPEVPTEPPGPPARNRA